MKVVLLITQAQSKDYIEAAFDRLPILIGRSKICDLVLDDAIASRQHAVLESADDHRLEVVDLDSANGVVFQGQKVRRQRLEVGDEFRLGDSSITIKKIMGTKDETTIHDLTPLPEVIVPEVTSTKILVSQETPIDPKQVEKFTQEREAQPIPRAPETPSLEVTTAPEEAPAMPELGDELTMKTPLALKDPVRSRGIKTKDWVQVSLFWKDELIDIRCFGQGDTVTVGKKGENDFVIEGIEFANSLPFVKVLSHGIELNLGFAGTGIVETRGKAEKMEELRKRARQTEEGLCVALPFQDRCLIELGPFSFFIQSVRLVLNEDLEAPLIKEPVFSGLLGSVSVIFAIFLAIVFAFPAAEAESEEEKPTGVVELALPTEKPKEIKKEPPPPPPPVRKSAPKAAQAQQRVQQSGTQGEGARARGAEGRRGEASSRTDSGGRKIAFQTKTAPPKPVPPKGAGGDRRRSEAKRGLSQSAGTGTSRPTNQAQGKQGPSLQPKPEVKVEDEGLAGVFGGSGGGGTGDSGRAQGVGLGGDLEASLRTGQARGGLSGSRGSGGRGSRGTDYGGGGQSIEVGGLGTKGKGGGRSGFGLGTSGTKGEAEVSYTIQEVSVLDGLTREEIERVVNSHRNQINACYEKSLAMAGGAGLSGRLKVSWFVNTQGRAINVQRKSAFGSEAGLYDCIARAIGTWQFPRPRGGKGATVVWPWTFQRGG